MTIWSAPEGKCLEPQSSALFFIFIFLSGFTRLVLLRRIFQGSVGQRTRTKDEDSTADGQKGRHVLCDNDLFWVQCCCALFLFIFLTLSGLGPSVGYVTRSVYIEI